MDTAYLAVCSERMLCMSTAPPERPFRLVVNVPVAMVQQYDALAVARGITRAKLVNAALDLALPQMRVADLDKLPYDPRSRRGPRRLHARKGTPAHTLIQVRDLAVPYVKNRPGLEPADLRGYLQSFLTNLPASEQPDEQALDHLLDELCPVVEDIAEPLPAGKLPG